jgi:molecular chaperone DnaK (HSP70)
MPRQERTLGIDLGTTYLAIFEKGEAIPVQYGRDVYPSIVHIQDGAWDVLPRIPSLDQSGAFLRFAKLVIGRGRGDGRLEKDIEGLPHLAIGAHGAVFELGHEKYAPEEVSGFLLGKIYRSLKLASADDLKRVVIAVPAYFHHQQRVATIDAAFLGGFSRDVIETVEEPVAAYVGYVHSNPGRNFDRKKALVLDVGGGTTDVTVLTLNDGKIYCVEATAGDNHLGGVDFDKALQEIVLEAGAPPYKVDKQRLLVECEDKKIELSDKEKVSVMIPPMDSKEQALKVIVTREEFLRRCGPALAKIGHLIDETKCQPDIVLLVGGSTKMPSLKELCDKKFGNKVVQPKKPEEIVAKGASIIAGDGDIQIQPVLPRSIGLDVHQGDELVTEIMAHRNHWLPLEITHSVATAADNQSEVLFEIFEGESRETRLNTLVGSFTIKEIPPCPKGSPINLKVSIDKPGFIRISATLAGSQASLEIEPRPRIPPMVLERWQLQTSNRLDGDYGDGSQDGHHSTAFVESRFAPPDVAEQSNSSAPTLERILSTTSNRKRLASDSEGDEANPSRSSSETRRIRRRAPEDLPVDASEMAGVLEDADTAEDKPELLDKDKQKDKNLES